MDADPVVGTAGFWSCLRVAGPTATVREAAAADELRRGSRGQRAAGCHDVIGFRIVAAVEEGSTTEGGRSLPSLWSTGSLAMGRTMSTTQHGADEYG